jgi:quinol monooxygenase YgiN
VSIDNLKDSQAIVLNVVMNAVPGREEDLARELRSLVTPTRQEPGCISYRLHLDPETPGTFMFYECFRDQESLDRHVSSPHFQEFLKYRNGGGDPVASQTVTRWRSIE